MCATDNLIRAIEGNKLISQVSDKVLEEFGEAYTAAVADVMSSLGYRAVIELSIWPLFLGVKVFGRAMTPGGKGDRDLAQGAKAAAKNGGFVVIERGKL